MAKDFQGDEMSRNIFLMPTAPALACHSLKLLSFTLPCVRNSAVFLMGKHFHLRPQLELQESSAMGILGNYSSSSGFKLLPP